MATITTDQVTAITDNVTIVNKAVWDAEFTQVYANDDALNTAELAHEANTTTPHGVTGAAVGTTNTQTLTNKTIDGSNNTLSNLDATSMTGAVPIANGGSGQTTAQAAIDALTQVSGATLGQTLSKDGSGNAVWTNAPAGGDLLSANNLSDVASSTAALANLGGGVGDMISTLNLSDLASATDAITNLGAADLTSIQTLTNKTFDATSIFPADLTSANISALSTLSISALGNEQITALQGSTVGTITPQQVIQTVVNTSEVSALTTAQIGALTTADRVSIDVNGVKYLTDPVTMVPQLAGGGGGYEFVETLTASSDATLTFTTAFVDGFDYLIKANAITTSGDGIQMQALLGVGGGTFRTANYTGSTAGLRAATPLDVSATANITLLSNIGFTGNEYGKYSLELINPAGATETEYSSHGGSIINTGAYDILFVEGKHTTAEAMVEIRLQPSSGNIDTGTFKLYKRANA